MDASAVDAWLARYGAAWQARAPEDFAALFSPDVRYHWTPFEEPKRGRDGVRAAFAAATSTQRDIDFHAELLALTDAGALARWTCSLERIATGGRVRLDGIFLMEFADDGTCELFREWWHSDEQGRG